MFDDIMYLLAYQKNSGDIPYNYIVDSKILKHTVRYHIFTSEDIDNVTINFVFQNGDVCKSINKFSALFKEKLPVCVQINHQKHMQVLLEFE